MRYLFIICLLAGCVGPDHSLKDFLTPDEFHVFYSEGAGSSSGTSYGRHDPWRRFSAQESDYTAWTLGLSWSLTSPGSEGRELREAARQMQISARLMSESVMAARIVPEPVAVARDAEVAQKPCVAPAATPASSDPTVVIMQPGLAPVIDITVENSASVTQRVPVSSDMPAPPVDGSEEPQGVKLLGIGSEVWTQLLVALGLLVTAVAGYLGREKIPVVKHMTKKGRAAKTDAES